MYKGDGFKAKDYHTLLRHPNTIEVIMRHYSVKDKCLIRLCRESERAHRSVNSLGAWSLAHLMAGATLPLKQYFVNFLKYVGITPF